MTKLTYAEFKNRMIEHNKTEQQPIYGVIVFREDTFSKVYPLDSRSYVVSSDNKAFGDYSGYSIFGSSMDGSDMFIRLDCYIAEECDNGKGWEVDYCYFIDDIENFDCELNKMAPIKEWDTEL